MQDEKLIESVEQACAQLGIAPQDIQLDLSKLPEDLRAPAQAFVNLLVAHKAQQAGRTFDWNDYSQHKHFPVFDLEVDEDVNPTGFRFCDSGYGDYFADLAGGSRLCLHSAKEANHMGKAFAADYEKILKV